VERVSCPAEHQRITGHAQTGAAQKYIVSATRDIHLDDELKPHVEDWLDLHGSGRHLSGAGRGRLRSLLIPDSVCGSGAEIAVGSFTGMAGFNRR
jgi:hypothetical protein